MWDASSFVIGLMIGLIIGLILVWITYSTRTFIFSNCPSHGEFCTASQYINDPSFALAYGYPLEDILFLKDGQLYYKRVKKDPFCVPSPTELVKVQFPQYCLFTTIAGQEYEGRLVEVGSGVYDVRLSDDSLALVETTSSCSVKRSVPAIFVSGTPELKWDSQL